ncbi:uncharacterized protein LOC121394769 isoform X3 [Xenopus laevis]|uniref:Uncharacterized protein LOC121394769 isoform X3 n=1 Tax=Xenopus laevis TaxID=8355 RepID=A0A8J1KZ90_XENLA|nr:uncharacterized protein LOC121394769 isoform X3 [Xenopus laevis]
MAVCLGAAICVNRVSEGTRENPQPAPALPSVLFPSSDEEPPFGKLRTMLPVETHALVPAPALPSVFFPSADKELLLWKLRTMLPVETHALVIYRQLWNAPTREMKRAEEGSRCTGKERRCCCWTSVRSQGGEIDRCSVDGRLFAVSEEDRKWIFLHQNHA